MIKVKERYITIIVSIIWGLGLACLLKNILINGETVIIDCNKLINNKNKI